MGIDFIISLLQGIRLRGAETPITKHSNKQNYRTRFLWKTRWTTDRILTPRSATLSEIITMNIKRTIPIIKRAIPKWKLHWVRKTTPKFNSISKSINSRKNPRLFQSLSILLWITMDKINSLVIPVRSLRPNLERRLSSLSSSKLINHSSRSLDQGPAWEIKETVRDLLLLRQRLLRLTRRKVVPHWKSYPLR